MLGNGRPAISLRLTLATIARRLLARRAFRSQRRWRISASMIYRVRKQLVEEGFEAVLSRKQRAMPAVARIFEEAKLIALACPKPPKGGACWTLRLLENKVAELGIVDRASDSTRS
jgi:hypothetical protein